MPLGKKEKKFAYINRELAWLDFNGRVLEQARRTANPLLERLRFLSITASNLDEFFMVRVGGLQTLRLEGKRRPDPAGMTPAGQLKAISQKAHDFIREQYAASNDIKQALEAHGLKRLRINDLKNSKASRLREWCQNNLLPLLTPMSLDRENITPLLRGLRLYLLIRLNVKGADRFIAMPMDQAAQRLRFLPESDNLYYVLFEDVVTANLDLWFPNAEIKEAVPFRITRNADLAVHEDEGELFVRDMEKILQEREESHVVRLEIPQEASAKSICFLKAFFDLADDDIYTIPGPLQLADYIGICDLEALSKLRFKPWTPCPSAEFNMEDSIFTQIAAKDILLFHPYESFAPVIRFVEEAAADPDVLTIKQILYRTSANSSIVAALERAALSGKYVTAVVELKARFDEERNIGWARRLERAGVQVIYGVQDYKIHAKCCLVVRRENEYLRRYTHWSTGNYNEKTALLYTDLGLFSAREDLGADAAALFNALCGLDIACNFHKISIAPLNLREQVTLLIDNEIRLAKAGHKALLMCKMNALNDEGMIAKYYEASQAGVEIKMNVRGPCCLMPGIPGLSENIRVISIVGRYLEHARIQYYHNNGNPLVFITSADCMTRNISKRVEALIPVESKTAIKKLKAILDIYWEDNENLWELRPDGVFYLTKPGGKDKIVNAQKTFEAMALQQSKIPFESKGFKPLRGRPRNR